MPTKSLKPDTDDLRPEYDLAALKGGVRGKYYRRASSDVVVVRLEPDVAAAFPTAPSVNRALREYLRTTGRRKLAVKSPRPAARRAAKRTGSHRG